MHISVVIPSYKGAKKLPQVLSALVQQRYKAFETIVVADGSVDNSVEIAETFAPQLNLRVLNKPNQNRSTTRNAGAMEAKGDLLIFFDDDMRPEPHCIAHHVLHHLNKPGSILVGPQLEEWSAMRTDIQCYKASLSRKWMEPLMQYKEALTKSNLFLTAANFSVPATVFRSLNGFDERLTDAEDFDLAVRAFQQDIPLYFDANALAWHDDLITCQSYIKRLRQYQDAHRKLRLLKPEIYQQFNLYQYNRIKGLKKFIYSILSSQSVVNKVDNDIFRLLPKNIKYKFYDIVTTGLAVYFPDRPL